MTSFGDNLKTIRTQLNMNQKELGDRLGVGQTTIANYEKGVRFPTGDLLKRIGEVLNVSIDQLMGHQVVNTAEEPVDLKAFKEKLKKCLIEGNEQEALYMIWQLNPSKDNILIIYEEILLKIMVDIGEMWERGEVNVAVEHFATQVVHKILSMMSTITGEVPKGKYSVLCMSLNSEPHTVGMRMISEYFSLLGITPYYIGTSVPTDSVIMMLKNKKVNILALSATMSYHLDGMKNLIEVVKRDPSLKALKIIVGGQAFDHNQEIWKDLGADGFAKDFISLKTWLEEEMYIDIVKSSKP
ncbi:helix-turn-helix domain-containing protein [Petrocella sp. FN5]|uniref:helix-turn-helix domain-containing protein n=1 Tax=Petrocella sp. FN5 TaxID=3032002 RepID=UPI0023DC1D79|nr:helix-turn-helix domain-containing protein [Petrocella sp. FN5]MDF1617784.1 helix-turn-helix domain-containing protein [Petrocella sp. FN5]